MLLYLFPFLFIHSLGLFSDLLQNYFRSYFRRILGIILENILGINFKLIILGVYCDMRTQNLLICEF